MRSSATAKKLAFVALILSLTAVVVLAPGCARSSPTETSSALAPYWPTDAWRVSTPEEQGVSSSALLKMLGRVDEQQLNLHSLHATATATSSARSTTTRSRRTWPCRSPR